MGAHSHVDRDRTFMARVEHRANNDRDQIAKAIARDAARLAPGSIGRHIRAEGGTIVCDHPAWAFVEYGTPPHIIRSHGPWPLRDQFGNVFGRVVHHPGTTAQPFLRPAMYRSRTP